MCVKLYMIKLDEEECRHICDICIYNWLRLSGGVIDFEYYISENANVIETLITKTRLFKYMENFTSKTENFQIKKNSDN